MLNLISEVDFEILSFKAKNIRKCRITYWKVKTIKNGWKWDKIINTFQFMDEYIVLL